METGRKACGCGNGITVCEPGGGNLHENPSRNQVKRKRVHQIEESVICVGTKHTPVVEMLCESTDKC